MALSIKCSDTCKVSEHSNLHGALRLNILIKMIDSHFLEPTLASGSASATPFFIESDKSNICLSKLCVLHKVSACSRKSQQVLRISRLLWFTWFCVIIGINRGACVCWMMNFMHVMPAVAITCNTNTYYLYWLIR